MSNTKEVEIVYLFLTKLEQFSPEERKEMLKVIQWLNAPVITGTSNPPIFINRDSLT